MVSRVTLMAALRRYVQLNFFRTFVLPEPDKIHKGSTG